MTAPSSRPDAPDCPRCGSPGASFSTHPCNPPDTTAQEHADTVREALNFGYGGDPNYRPFYEDGITALDALLAEVERLTAERDEARAELRQPFAMAERLMAETEAAEALAERRGAALEQAIEDLEVIRADFPGTLRALEIEGNVKHYRAALADGGDGDGAAA